MSKLTVCPGHTEAVFNPQSLPKIAEWAADILFDEEADAILVCGHSGLLLAGALLARTLIPVIAVRKKGEPTVAGSGPISTVLPNGKAKRWVWVDDCISTGGTFRHAVETAWKHDVIATPVPTAIVTYCDTTKGRFFVGLGGNDDEGTYLRGLKLQNCYLPGAPPLNELATVRAYSKWPW